MASEYLIQKARRELQPPEPPRVYTRKEKFQNWLHYNKLWLAIAAVLLWITGSMLWNVLGIGRTRPDLIIAYVGSRDIPDESVRQLEQALAALGQDLNGDGQVFVELRRYRINYSGDVETAMYYNYASDTSLLADITAGDSVFFLTEDPNGVQRSFQIFAQPDGSAPAEQDYDAMDKVVRWGDCPALAALTPDEPLFEGLYLGRRYFYDEKQAARHEGCEMIWNAFIREAF